MGTESSAWKSARGILSQPLAVTAPADGAAVPDGGASCFEHEPRTAIASASLIMGAIIRFVDRYDRLVAELRAEIPGFRVVRKDRSRFHRAIDVALRIVTLGQMRDYLGSYQTTIGKVVYVTADWDELDRDQRYVTLRHEAVHLRQFRKLSLPVMAVLYVLVPLPMGLAYFRARFEQEAYAETIRATAEVFGPHAPRAQAFRERIVRQFTGPSYGWMWPFRAAIERWYDGVLTTL